MASGIFTILNAADLDRSFAFYKGLGLRVKDERVDMGGNAMRFVTILAGGDHRLMVVKRDFEGADPADVAWASGDVGKGVLVNIGVPNVAKVHQAAKASGAKPGELMPNPWGGSTFWIADPDGYYLAIADKFPGSGTRKAAAKKSARKGAKKTAKKATKKARRR